MKQILDLFKAKKWLMITVICTLALAVCTGAFALFTALHDTVMPRVKVEGVSLGGMTREEANTARQPSTSPRRMWSPRSWAKTLRSVWTKKRSQTRQ